jgi:hypothetical protein
MAVLFAGNKQVIFRFTKYSKWQQYFFFVQEPQWIFRE